MAPSSPRGARALCVAIACPASNGRWTAKGSRRDAHAQRCCGYWVLDHAGAYTNVNGRLGARELVRLCACANGGNAQVSVLRARPGGLCKDLVAVVSAPSIGLRRSGTVFTCGQRGAVSSPEARSKGPRRGGAALVGGEHTSWVPVVRLRGATAGSLLSSSLSSSLRPQSFGCVRQSRLWSYSSLMSTPATIFRSCASCSLLVRYGQAVGLVFCCCRGGVL